MSPTDTGKQRKKGRQAVRRLLLLSVLLVLTSCSDRALSLFFDIPPPTQEELAAKARAEAEPTAALAAAKAGKDGSRLAQNGNVARPSSAKRVPPEIEKATTWKEAEKFFPMDREGRKGRPDWTEAVRRGIIAPRESIDGSPRASGQVFKYDFFLAAPESDPGYEAYFPHSTHTEWVSCESCHPKIFPVRGETITKKKIKKGKYCGVCHKKKNGPAFWLRACDRCHLLAQD